MARTHDISRLRANLQGEVDSAARYLPMAAQEPDAEHAEVYRQLAAVEQRPAEAIDGAVRPG